MLSLGDEVDTPQLTQDEMNALVDEAHRLRKKAAAHAHGAEAAKVAIRAGIDSIEHGSFLDDEALRMMKEKGTYLVPTCLAGRVHGAARRATTAGDRRQGEGGGRLARGGAQEGRGDGREDRLRHRLGGEPARRQRAGVRLHGGSRHDARGRPARGHPGASTLLGLDKHVGTLEAGKEADIVAVPGDPLADVKLTEKVSFVMKGGTVYKNE